MVLPGWSRAKMAPFPEEVDVFSAPHWRMKKLVNLYSEKLSNTNFSNSRDFQSLLTSLYATFTEFKSHEQIENEYIMDELQHRLRALSVCNSSVSNVHSDNKLSDMLSLFEKGLKNFKNEYEQLNYSRQLKERLDAFTKDFIPHMKEEEEVFQPLLMEYFTYEELKDIKVKVIAQHCTHGHVDTVEVLKELQLWSQTEELQKADKNSPSSNRADRESEPEANNTHVSQLPPEVLLKVLGYLNPRELCRARQVNTRWSRLAGSGALWRHLYPISWVRGNWYSGPPSSLNLGPDYLCEDEDEEEDLSREWDEDADIDESEEAGPGLSTLSKTQREALLLPGLIHYLLPQVGVSVKTLVLAYSSSLSSQMVRQILNSCPKLEHLDLTQTAVTDSAFNRCVLGSCRSLRHLDLSGCDRITDSALHHLSRALGDLAEEDCQSGGWRSECTWAPHGCHVCPPEDGAGLWTQGGAGRVWLLPEEELLDIEEAGGLKLRGPRWAAPPRSPPSGAIAARCIRDAHCQRAQAPCGHTLCAADAKLRTKRAPPPQCNKMVRTRGSEGSYSTGRWRVGVDPDSRSLRFLSLSGCFQITDHGLRALMLHGGLPFLEHLDLSGCLLITGRGLQDLVSVCPALKDEYFFYCDNISGPHANTASGCQNLQCSVRACCRSGE
ncbi:F-box/LRR-repeat protein 5 isoform X2 [Carcharodon carcharias]|uniref:F-box/LRR-repeat protein 5 isoform X2 n=1 Tax=Carcharodon carcharias TaxID=13397 RepID=UPI001B7F2AAE|nr:F-box/LRR-repeat protein 5 isoform X2 [Carcharodon carcharias]